MTLGLLLFLGLFAHDNADFLNQSKANTEAGHTWEYVGRTPVENLPDYYTLPLVNQNNGDKVIFWKHKEPSN